MMRPMLRSICHALCSQCCFTPALILFALAATIPARAAELSPSFPNHAIVAEPTPESRQVKPRAADIDTPFSWDQYAVVFEGQQTDKVFRGFDPDPNPQPVLINILPATPTHLKVLGFDGNLDIQSVQILPKQAGTTEVFQFQPMARNIVGDISNFIYDIRATNTKIRTIPAVTRSPGTFIKPGQIVRYTWTQTSTSERFAKCEAELTGRTGQATGLFNSTITSVLGVKTRPVVLGHYLMLVTPRDVRGQPPLGSTGNGVVFRCAFGSDNLPPVADGFFTDSFTPDVNQIVTLQPNVTDPETGQTTFDNQSYEFGDGSVAAGITGSTTHAYAAPGIYRMRCTVADDQGLQTTAEDSIVVGATILPKLTFQYVKEIPPEEAGDGLNNADSLTVTFRDPSGTKIVPGDRIVFTYNRNHFGRVSASDNADDVDIIIKPGGTFSGKTRIANNISIAVSGATLSIKVSQAQFDRTGDPRFGRCELKGIFKNQRIALAIIPADNSTPRALLYTGNMQGMVKNGASGRFFFVPETHIVGIATIKEPNPRLQEP